MSNATADIRRYTAEVIAWLRGDGPATHLQQHAAPVNVPVYVAAITSRTVERAAEIACGIMPVFWSPERVRRSKAWVERGRARRSDGSPVDVTLGVPVFVGDDLDALRDAARHNLALYTFFPFFQRLFRASGFTAEADAMQRGEGAAALTNELLDSICLIGPLERCQQRLAEYRSAGVDMPILVAPLGVEGARNVIAGFRRRVETPERIEAAGARQLV